MKQSVPAQAEGLWKKIQRRVNRAPRSARAHYWDDLQAELRHSRDRLLSNWTDGATLATVESLADLPEGAQAVMLSAPSGADRDPVGRLTSACADLAPSSVQTIFISLESQHAAIHRLRERSSEEMETPEIDRAVLLRRIHLHGPFRLRRERCLRARLSQLDVLQLERSSDLACGPGPAQVFHGCRVLYQVRSASPTRPYVVDGQRTPNQEES